MPAGVSQIAVPGTLILQLTAAHDTVIGAPPHDAVLGREMTIFASALDAHDGMSVSSREVENQFNDFPEGDHKLAVLQDDSAGVHSRGLMATSLMHLR
jgi:hypothetical protein